MQIERSSRHMNSMHHPISITETQINVFPVKFVKKKEQFTENINISKNLLESINIAYNKWTTTNDGEAFYLSFYSTVILKFSAYLCPLESPQEQSITKSTPVNNKEISALQYLAGDVVRKIKPKVLKVGLSRSKKLFYICFNESPLKMKKNAYFILKALFVPKIFKFLSWLFGHIEKRLD